MNRKLLLKHFLLREKDTFYMADDWLLPRANKPAHTHDFYEFFIVTEGQITQALNGETVELSERELQIIVPADAHSLCATRERSKIRNIAIDAAYFEQRLSELQHTPESLPKRIRLEPFVYAELIEKTDMARKHIHEPALYRFLMKSVLDTVFIHACLCADREQGAPLWLAQLCEEMHLTDNFIAGLPRMLALSCKSQGYLNRCIKKYVGVTVTEYINALRLEHAAKLLRTTDKKVVDIAFECGFESVPYFNKIFKKAFLETPHTYRSRCIF